jgi:ferric-dicitrate binding protein FerR (iron transport regulator)
VKPLDSMHGVRGLAIPPEASGQGILFVNATPWGTVFVNGFDVGETPQQVRLPAGRHRVRVARPNQRGVETEVTVEAGQRVSFLR